MDNTPGVKSWIIHQESNHSWYKRFKIMVGTWNFNFLEKKGNFGVDFLDK